ncbi:phage tail protein [Pseudanabaenaceae cyanobacterium LEGE 13415]|nr:phage tail protein [Pseudanabaenaceae cyanobacterium LEGE 13415]
MPAIKPPHNPDPYGGYNFFIEWNGIIHAGFQECTGLDSTQQAGEYREGTDPLTMRKIPGLVSYSNITLSRGITNNDELWQWRDEFVQGKGNRREVSIVLRDDTGEERIRWNLTNCWPTTWKGADLKANADDFALETLELAHEGIKVDKWT